MRSVVVINGGCHTNRSFAGNTVYAWSEILDKMPLPDRADVAALRVRTVATKDQSCQDFIYQDSEGKYDPSVIDLRLRLHRPHAATHGGCFLVGWVSWSPARRRHRFGSRVRRSDLRNIANVSPAVDFHAFPPLHREKAMFLAPQPAQ